MTTSYVSSQQPFTAAPVGSSFYSFSKQVLTAYLCPIPICRHCEVFSSHFTEGPER